MYAIIQKPVKLITCSTLHNVPKILQQCFIYLNENNINITNVKSGTIDLKQIDKLNDYLTAQKGFVREWKLYLDHYGTFSYLHTRGHSMREVFTMNQIFFQTYNLNAQIGESSACATALLCGVKANFETVGLDGNGKFENCYSSFASRVDSLAYWAQQQVYMKLDSNKFMPHLHLLGEHWITDEKLEKLLISSNDFLLPKKKPREQIKLFYQQLIETDKKKNTSFLRPPKNLSY
ncbi:hypothetical protein AGLY_009511 [Aphis glycines]|uniref:alkaline phosphatase n=1 Tax=Aphis glycines TaxID=307491 RepID=A0A6G0THQ9_APHGL|nr:hypothetical protein AGLY_009511 [Aphis glycines]